MNKHIGLCLTLVLVLLLAPVAAQARYMNPDTGRFQTMDSYEGNQQDPQSLHKYVYCQNNPANGIDPSGHEFTSISLAVASGIGVGLDASYNSTVSAAGIATMNTLFNVQFGATVDEMLPHWHDEISFEDGFSYEFTVMGFGGDEIASIKASIVPANESGVTVAASVGGPFTRDAQGQMISELASPVEQGRDPKTGRFLRKVPGQSSPGSSAEDEFAALAKANGFEVKRNVTFKTPFGNRRFEVVLRDPKTGKASGVEVKSSEGAMNRNDVGSRQQFAADRYINRQAISGKRVVAIGQHTGTEIESTYKIRWQPRASGIGWIP